MNKIILTIVATLSLLVGTAVSLFLTDPCPECTECETPTLSVDRPVPPVITAEEPAPEPKPEPATWVSVPSEEWSDLLPGEWEGAEGFTAEFEANRKGSKTPFNAKLRQDSKDYYLGCGFYESGTAFCRGEDDASAFETKLTIERREDDLRVTVGESRLPTITRAAE